MTASPLISNFLFNRPVDSHIRSADIPQVCICFRLGLSSFLIHHIPQLRLNFRNSFCPQHLEAGSRKSANSTPPTLDWCQRFHHVMLSLEAILAKHQLALAQHCFCGALVVLVIVAQRFDVR